MGGMELPGIREDGLSVPAAGELGGVVSGVWSTAAGLDLRADFSTSRAAMSGIGVACPLGGGECGLSSTSEASIPVDVVAVRSTGWRTGAMVGLEHRRFGQIQWLGLGAVAGWSRSWGVLPEDAAAEVPDSPPLAIADWSVDGIHFGVSVSLHR